MKQSREDLDINGLSTPLASESDLKKIKSSDDTTTAAAINRDDDNVKKAHLMALKSDADNLWVNAMSNEDFEEDDGAELLDKPFQLYRQCYQLLKELTEDYPHDPVGYYFCLRQSFKVFTLQRFIR